MDQRSPERTGCPHRRVDPAIAERVSDRLAERAQADAEALPPVSAEVAGRAVLPIPHHSDAADGRALPGGSRRILVIVREADGAVQVRAVGEQLGWDASVRGRLEPLRAKTTEAVGRSRLHERPGGWFTARLWCRVRACAGTVPRSAVRPSTSAAGRRTASNRCDNASRSAASRGSVHRVALPFLGTPRPWTVAHPSGLPVGESLNWCAERGSPRTRHVRGRRGGVDGVHGSTGDAVAQRPQRSHHLPEPGRLERGGDADGLVRQPGARPGGPACRQEGEPGGVPPQLPHVHDGELLVVAEEKTSRGRVRHVADAVPGDSSAASRPSSGTVPLAPKCRRTVSIPCRGRDPWRHSVTRSAARTDVARARAARRIRRPVRPPAGFKQSSRRRTGFTARAGQGC